MSIYTIYGRPKVGKTTMALKDAKKGKTAILSADQGLIGIDTTGFTVDEDLSTKNLNKLVNSTWLSKHERFVVDTATSLHSIMLSEAAGGKAASQAHYGAANNGLALLLRTLRDEKKEVVVLAQEKLILPNEDWGSDDVDEDTGVMTTVDLSPGAASALLQMSDVIGRLYIAHVNGKPVRRLWLGPSSSIVAGARSKVYQGNPPYLKSPSITRLNQLLGWTR
ncbi:AAA-ATPase [Microbacterium phage Lucky3]|uniref:AAA-ATPase n=2 Tax=Kojivirus golden TaxID=2560590 RepID=A0A2P1CFT5_9CAUD|nr:AAA-ATPase [Microbacterium phage Golden]AVJ49781.1 AAA-ATPase [Microbacterium phage Golden]AVJ50091.1 AAA-ATPase [Microbacterium phage Lucky3]